jgi:hypothetical protein
VTVCYQPTAVWMWLHRMARASLPSAAVATEEHSRTEDDPFDPRELPSPIHERDPRHKRREPSHPSLYLLDRREGSRRRPRCVSREGGRDLGGRSFASVIITTREHEPLLLLLARPPPMPWLAIHRESLLLRAAPDLSIRGRRCKTDVAFRLPHVIAWGGWTSTRHTAPLVVVHGVVECGAPANQRHDHARPKDLEWRTPPRRDARTAGPRHPPSSYRSLTAGLVGEVFDTLSRSRTALLR